LSLLHDSIIMVLQIIAATPKASFLKVLLRAYIIADLE